MLSIVNSATLLGVESIPVRVEVDVLPYGLPGIQVVGLPSTSVQESKDRVRSAIARLGIRLPPRKIVMNLAPSNIPKHGSGFDLPIALGMLSAYGELPKLPDDMLFLGEVSLDGSVRTVRGVLTHVLKAKEHNISKIVIPEGNFGEVVDVITPTIIPVRTLKDACEVIKGKFQPSIERPKEYIPQPTFSVDFSEVLGQHAAKRALQIAAAGRHNILLIGVPGAGKTRLARALPGILPPLTQEEQLEVTALYSVAGRTEGAVVHARPFRAPHHTTTLSGLIGGGGYPTPGELSLAHHGVLFLDELPEFSSHTLDCLRQPLEDREVQIARSYAKLRFPANVMLVAAANPCPCGYQGSKKKQCTCSVAQLAQYQRKLSGPLLDRIDLQLFVHEVEHATLIKTQNDELSSDTLRNGVLKAWHCQQERYKNQPIHWNAELSSKHVWNFLCCSDDVRSFMYYAAERMQLSGRGFFSVLKIARTIADLEERETVEKHHLAEALQYRSLEVSRSQ